MTLDELRAYFEGELVIGEREIGLFDRYLDLLEEWNERMNLTAVRDRGEMVEKHLLDSLLAMKALKGMRFSSAIDIGTGPGFPGMVLAILMEDVRWTLLDATRKKCEFLSAVKRALRLGNVEVMNARAETLPKERWDLATARAFSSLPMLLELGAPLLSVGGHLLAMKGPRGEEELHSSLRAMKELRIVHVSTCRESLPGGNGERLNLLFRKVSKTPRKYPREFSLLKAKPI